MLSALVVTHDRPTLAGQTVRYLIEKEGVRVSDIVLVVNGVGGLDDPDLERQVDKINTGSNLGPAGGFAVGLNRLRTHHSTPWSYVCEDDIGLLSLPAERSRQIIRSVGDLPTNERSRVGAVLAYGRVMHGRAGRTVPHVCHKGTSQHLERVDTGAWGATLIHRRVLDARLRPDPELFFGFEDFDFFMKMQEAGLIVYVDCLAERAVIDEVSTAGRNRLFVGRRPTDAQEPWRYYYGARNFCHLARRHGSYAWTALHPLNLLRQWTLDARADVAIALARGYRDGLLGRLGRNDLYQRTSGELRPQTMTR